MVLHTCNRSTGEANPERYVTWEDWASENQGGHWHDRVWRARGNHVCGFREENLGKCCSKPQQLWKQGHGVLRRHSSLGPGPTQRGRGKWLWQMEMWLHSFESSLKLQNGQFSFILKRAHAGDSCRNLFTSSQWPEGTKLEPMRLGPSSSVCDGTGIALGASWGLSPDGYSLRHEDHGEV